MIYNIVYLAGLALLAGDVGFVRPDYMEYGDWRDKDGITDVPLDLEASRHPHHNGHAGIGPIGPTLGPARIFRLLPQAPRIIYILAVLKEYFNILPELI